MYIRDARFFNLVLQNCTLSRFGYNFFISLDKTWIQKVPVHYRSCDDLLIWAGNWWLCLELFLILIDFSRTIYKNSPSKPQNGSKRLKIYHIFSSASPFSCIPPGRGLCQIIFPGFSSWSTCIPSAGISCWTSGRSLSRLIAWELDPVSNDFDLFTFIFWISKIFNKLLPLINASSY